MKDRRRVVVTGIGFRSPIGHTWDEIKVSLLTGRSGIKVIRDWDKIKHLRTRVAGVCENVDEMLLPRTTRRTMGRVGILATLAVRDAIIDAGLSDAEITAPYCGISFGSTGGSVDALEVFFKELFGNKNHYSLKGLQPSTYLKSMSHTCAANIATTFRVTGRVIATCAACVAGSQGIGFGLESIQAGKADIMISGGAEEMHFITASVFDIMHATSSKYNETPERTPRPFDVDRDGLVTAEGGACLLLEEFERAQARNAKIYAEVVGFGTNCDGTHLINPSSVGMAGAMCTALKDAGLSPDDIEHVNAHATATAAGDLAEGQAIFNVFGSKVPVSGFKGYMGHTLGACGALESIISIVMMREGFIAPTRNLQTPDPALPPLNHMIGEPRDANLSIVMNNNFAFGGINTSLVFKNLSRSTQA
jgi:3-oxoacyl-(acyl-carrier-protein) synthase